MSKIYRIHEFGERIGKSTSTLRRWDKEGRLVAKRHPSGHRFYDESDVRRVFGIKEEARKTVVYCRASSRKQQDDLQAQVTAMETFCLAGALPVDSWIEEVGSGLNYKRKKFLQLMSDTQHGLISKLIIAHEDRLVRFGFDYFKHMAEENGCQIIVVNQRTLSPRQELVEDLLAIVNTFLERLPSLNKYKKQLKKDLNE